MIEIATVLTVLAGLVGVAIRKHLTDDYLDHLDKHMWTMRRVRHARRGNRRLRSYYSSGRD
jgi:hypothetical protein